MKVATEVMIKARPEKIWETLTAYSSYSEWNRFVKSVQGSVAPDATIQIEIQYYGKSPEKQSATVTGYMSPKYLSWTWQHRFGKWFMATEHVFRLKNKEDGRSIFFQEIYVTGLGLKFRRRDIEHMIKLSMGKLNDDLKDRIEGSVADP